MNRMEARIAERQQTTSRPEPRSQRERGYLLLSRGYGVLSWMVRLEPRSQRDRGYLLLSRGHGVLSWKVRPEPRSQRERGYPVCRGYHLNRRMFLRSGRCGRS